jgi:hypothetical protein
VFHGPRATSIIALKDLAERQFSSTGRTNNSRVWEWVVDSCTEEFRCFEDDITLIENEDGEEIVHINGEPKARVIIKRQD